MTGTAIRMENLTRDFGAVRAVDGLSLEVPPGTIFGFLGPNGAGKTTTIHILLGLLEPTAGRAEVVGFDTLTQADEVRSRTGALLETISSPSVIAAVLVLWAAVDVGSLAATMARFRRERLILD